MPAGNRIALSCLPVGCLVALLSLSGCLGGGDAERSSERSAVSIPDQALELGCRLQEGSGSSRSDPRFREKSVVIGPVALFPARGEYPRYQVEEFPGDRFPLVGLLVALTRGEIPTGDTASVRLVGTATKHAAFFSSRVRYEPEGYRISDGAPALVARACEVGPGFRLYTTYNLGLLVDSARCVPLVVSVEGRRVGRGFVRFGTSECS